MNSLLLFWYFGESAFRLCNMTSINFESNACALQIDAIMRSMEENRENVCIALTEVTPYKRILLEERIAGDWSIVSDVGDVVIITNRKYRKIPQQNIARVHAADRGQGDPERPVARAV